MERARPVVLASAEAEYSSTSMYRTSMLCPLASRRRAYRSKPGCVPRLKLSGVINGPMLLSTIGGPLGRLRCRKMAPARIVQSGSQQSPSQPLQPQHVLSVQASTFAVSQHGLSQVAGNKFDALQHGSLLAP